MKIFNKIIQSPFLYPFLIAVYPILALWNTNFDRMGIIEIVVPISTTLLISLVVFLLLRLILRSWSKAALMTSLLVVLFFTYGHIFNLLVQYSLFGVRETQPRNFIIFWLLIFLAGSYFILRYGKGSVELNQYLNYVGLALVIMIGIQIGLQEIQAVNNTRQHLNNTRQHLNEVAQAGVGSDPFQLSSDKNSPDVYLIVLDGYMRDDKLKALYNYDNSEFMKQLTDLGFVIPSCTQSNYTYTPLSMSTELNMNYLDELDISLDQIAHTHRLNAFTEYIRHSLVRANFFKMGYKMFAFETSVKFIDIPDADVFIRGKVNIWQDFLDTTEFTDLLTQTSILRIYEYLQMKSPALAERIGQVLEKVFQSRSFDQVRYDAIMNELNQIISMPDISGKKFVYMHVVAPHAALHSNYILGADGSLSPTIDEKTGYTNGITYLNERMIPILKTLITKSARPPVIIVQGDHGWNDINNRNYNLNAYYLPDGGDKIIYPSITPVNTFRSIFNYYFGGNYPQLKDTSFYGHPFTPFKLTELPVICPRSAN